MWKIKEFYLALRNLVTLGNSHNSLYSDFYATKAKFQVISVKFEEIYPEYLEMKETMPKLVETINKLGDIIVHSSNFPTQSLLSNALADMNKVVNDPMEAVIIAKEKIEFNNQLIHSLQIKKSVIQGTGAVGSQEVIVKNKTIAELDQAILKLETINSDLAESSNQVSASTGS